MSNKSGAAIALLDPRLTRYPISPHGKGYVLTDRKGSRISFPSHHQRSAARTAHAH